MARKPKYGEWIDLGWHVVAIWLFIIVSGLFIPSMRFNWLTTENILLVFALALLIKAGEYILESQGYI